MTDWLSPEEWQAVALSLRVSLWATAVSLPFGIFVAYALARWTFPGKFLLNGLVHLPLILPPVVTGYLLLLTFGRRGVVGEFLDDWFGIVFAFHWTGAALGRNHETTYRDIFACFGFELPHNGGLFTFFGDIDTAAMPGIGEDATYALVNEREPFVSFAISRGHAMLILGKHDGAPVAFDQNGYSYTDGDDVAWQVKRCSIITPAIVSYFLNYPVTFLEIR